MRRNYAVSLFIYLNLSLEFDYLSFFVFRFFTTTDRCLPFLKNFNTQSMINVWQHHVKEKYPMRIALGIVQLNMSKWLAAAM